MVSAFWQPLSRPLPPCRTFCLASFTHQLLLLLVTQKKVAIDKINLSNLASSSSSSWVNLTTMMMKKQHLSIENIFHSLLLHESGGSRPPPLPTPANLRLIALSAEKLQQSWRDYGTIWHQDNLAPLCKNRQFSAYTLKVPYCPWCQIINVTKLSRDPVWRRLIQNQRVEKYICGSEPLLIVGEGCVYPTDIQHSMQSL